MRITSVTVDQFPIWKRLRQAVFTGFDPEFHDEEMQWLLESDQAECFLAWSNDNEPIGLLEMSLHNFVDGCIGSPVGYIEGIYLEPDHRGTGLGRRLIDFAAEWAKSKGCRHLATDAEIDNIEAQAFYRKIGFSEGWKTIGYTMPLDES